MKAGGAIYSDPVLAADKLYFGSDDGKLHCFDYKDGREKFAEPLNGSIRAQPALRGERLYIGTLEGYAYCLNALTGKPVVGWTRPFRTNGARQGAILAKAIPTDRGVYFGSEDGRLYCLDMASGELKWDFNAEGKITTAPLVTDGRIYLAAQADTGVLYALEEID
jgi:outer membrane protein assembly factor BamB